MNEQNAARISGNTAEDIATSIRLLIDAGELKAGDSLPPVRTLAESLGVNRNTALTAYQTLVQAGLAETRRRAGTVIIDPFAPGEEEGFAANTALRDVGDGNPSPELLPDPASVILSPSPRKLYGESTVDPGLAEWATEWINEDQPREFQLSVAAGAVDAVERLLAGALTQGDTVALEDPCFLTSISTIRQNGYRAVPVSMDAEGMQPESLRAALESGVRAVVCTPRAHNPTGASVTAERASQLREVLSAYPNVLLIEDDHFALLASAPYASIIGEHHRRWALVRSLSKVLGPDMRTALIASDPETAERLGARISGGITWVSHHMQRIAHAMLTSPDTKKLIARARAHYLTQNARCIAQLSEFGLESTSRDGLNVWVNTHTNGAATLAALTRKGWIARDGGAFALDGGTNNGIDQHVRLTVHDLSESEMRQLAQDLAESIGTPKTGRSTANIKTSTTAPVPVERTHHDSDH
ncbi:aminotransferase class I/II-fold pyridoxal phosphate-dependent enzyme [Leucobacter sp. UT-8R-CII-1-4]|uniref:aminotransferase class I/II-fold pyridoxal phosphate-dependent enzyme n=1 Tax=Leucobacter sp. UT-8R-CII-1-4 TaxID=3040075 RepID=UPI0024A95372|nr:aminotransferase class I/II-fold pyridoxal phosphate-dependent enzyme [Leucobacter sp. UT-8R-CII-1-4]MDI6022723.1 aminotransferase class I/II-fold pyridoxal phosphate-dependent enzyme [Leucobacter sp. UT-8R-CII-1-4]